MPGLVQFDSRSDAGFGCFTAVCTDALRWRATRSRMPRAPVQHHARLGSLVSYRPLATNLQSCKLYRRFGLALTSSPNFRPYGIRVTAEAPRLARPYVKNGA